MFIRNQRGQGMVEYILIVALVVVGAIGLWAVFGEQVQGMLTNASAEIGTAPGANQGR